MKSIEKSIPSKFDDSHMKAITNIFYTCSYLKKERNALYSKFGLTAQQHSVLNILSSQHPKKSNPGLIKEAMVDSSPDLTRLVDRLVAKKLVTRQICGSNRRQVEIGITSKGLDILVETTPARQEVFGNIYSSLSGEEAETLSKLLDKLRKGS